MPKLSDLVQQADANWQTYVDILSNAYSFVLKGKDTSLGTGEKLVAEFELGPGGWIVLAKATVRADTPDADDVRLLLTATENSNVNEDRSLASVRELGYATLSLMLGTHFAKGGKVELHALVQGARQCSLSHIVITAIKTEKLFVWDL